MGLKRTARLMFERAFNVHVVYRGKVAPVFEKDHLHKFFEHFKVDCVFDVGANAGQYANMLHTEVGYQGTIISFEPIPEVAQRLRANAATDRSWFVEELALDEREGQASFNILAGDQFSSLHAVSSTGSGLFKKQTRLSRRIEVRTSTIAIQLRKYQDKLGFKRPFLKMDTQGHDVSVANGAGDQLRQFVGLQSELAVKRLYDDSPSFEEALDFYRARGFELSALVPNNFGHFPRLLEIDCIMFRKDLEPGSGQEVETSAREHRGRN
jgi:FkbM family methyltransferase